MANDSLIEKCYEKSIAHLLNNTTKEGILAASPISTESKSKAYTSLFSRDIGVCAQGILSSGNHHLIDALRKSLSHLAEAQTELGQLPFYYKPHEKTTQWRQSGSIDSTLWWCIAFLQYSEQTGDGEFYRTHLSAFNKAFEWLLYQDSNNDSLLEQGEAADWADEMPRHGTVLYTNALWYWLVSLRLKKERKGEYEDLQKSIYDTFNTLFWVHKKNSSNTQYIPDNTFIRKNPYAAGLIELINSKVVYLPYYLGYVSHKNFETRCDVFGNVLACYVGLADAEKVADIIDFIRRTGVNKPYPLKVLYPPIYPGESDFQEYMTKGRQNYPWQYHNGGIWPFVGSFWVMLLAQFDKHAAAEELSKLAEANSLYNFEFNEYLHGENGTPMGVPYQSWNMAMYIAAYNEIKAVNKTLSHAAFGY